MGDSIKKRPSPTTVIAMLALFLAVGGATAIALPGTNTVDSGDIKNGQVKTKDLKGNSVSSGKVKPDTLTGADIQEGSLSTVPSANNANNADNANQATNANNAANLGGDPPSTYLGASNSNFAAFCDPNAVTFTNCVSTSLTLARSGRVVLVAGGGQVSFGGIARGTCRFNIDGTIGATPQVQPGESASDNTVDGATNGFAMTMRTAVLGAGAHTFALACNQDAGDQEIHESTISAQLVG